MNYQVELVWNREFHFVPWMDPKPSLEEAISSTKSIQNSGDGARVKKTRVVDEDGAVIWAYGKLVGNGS